ncbi:pentapeptide repeat-containing protein [Mastigocoleus testarum]|uniref:Pentapeptide repeat-containing protein n=1 Tax=Mastigocoleus testarum BC008 TaxID=371196 RepID=A0A0V7ZJK3_9CYAN|nr:pentapeptide repeat-containing protein [Mastigocoleus testarum]KST64535.1 hypothetical protein BC008_18075 [Mastigocoleus testarum BC008]
MHDLQNLTQENMFNHAVQLRNMDVGVSSMEQMAGQMVRYLYKNLTLPDGNSACALVRFFKTHPYQELPEDLQESAQGILKGREIHNATKCLTLVATAGDNSQWNSRKLSVGHKAIPLVDEDSVARIPMISQLISQFGVSVENVIKPDPEIILNLGKRTFNVFYIPEAMNSPYIPAQEEFVIPYQIKSVLGIGGMLLSGNIFTIILFSKIEIPFHVTHLFKWVAMYAKIATNSVEGDKNLFDKSPSPALSGSSNYQSTIANNTISTSNTKLQTSNTKLQTSRFQTINQSKVDISTIDFQNADLKGINLRNANLEGADLRGVNLKGANLEGTDLRGINLQGANLQGVNLQSVNFQGANLQGANLQGANLQGAIMPDGTIYQE